MKAFLVWNKEAGEGVVFSDRNDAVYAATERAESFGVSTLADEWRGVYGESGEKYEVREIEI